MPLTTTSSVTMALFSHGHLPRRLNCPPGIPERPVHALVHPEAAATTAPGAGRVPRRRPVITRREREANLTPTAAATAALLMTHIRPDVTRLCPASSDGQRAAESLR